MCFEESTLFCKLNIRTQRCVTWHLVGGQQTCIETTKKKNQTKKKKKERKINRKNKWIMQWTHSQGTVYTCGNETVPKSPEQVLEDFLWVEVGGANNIPEKKRKNKKQWDGKRQFCSAWSSNVITQYCPSNWDLHFPTLLLSLQGKQRGGGRFFLPSYIPSLSDQKELDMETQKFNHWAGKRSIRKHTHEQTQGIAKGNRILNHRRIISRGQTSQNRGGEVEGSRFQVSTKTSVRPGDWEGTEI